MESSDCLILNNISYLIEKIANKYNVELDRIDIGDTEQAQMDQDDIQMSMPRYVKQAQDNDLYLQKITLQELWDRTKDTDIPGHTTLYSNLGRGQGHNYIEDYSTNKWAKESRYL